MLSTWRSSSDFFPEIFLPKFWVHFIAMCATCIIHISFLNSITFTGYGEEYEFRNSSLHSLNHYNINITQFSLPFCHFLILTTDLSLASPKYTAG